MELHKIRKQINEYVLLNSKTIKLHMKYAPRWSAKQRGFGVIHAGCSED
jgi:hypothetical protein